MDENIFDKQPKGKQKKQNRSIIKANLNNKMDKDTRSSIQVWTAVAMLVIGAALSVAGFCVPPVGEISDSVLWFFAQCLIYAGSIFGITVYVNDKINKRMNSIINKIGENGSKGIKE